MRRRWCRASVGEQKRFPVIAIKFLGFLGQALRQFLFCVSPRLGPKYHLSDWGWCISGELLMLLAAAKNSHAPPGLTEPRSWSTWWGPDEKSNTAKMPLLWCCLLRRADPNLGQWGWIERLFWAAEISSSSSSWTPLLCCLSPRRGHAQLLIQAVGEGVGLRQRDLRSGGVEEKREKEEKCRGLRPLRRRPSTLQQSSVSSIQR